MIPGSLDTGERLEIPGVFQTFKRLIRSYFWPWIAYQTIKGIITTTVIWAPLAYLYLSR